ncbi:unnamed protein product [Rangifer tarandus platyrhynchus]|uniref:Uncharacterized protein n=2 Tax=Rangifer tarandus platyrhynchus TaxID=3082113 RepID=A0ABN8Y261_RANTA|nr:unnamed protein product [Rangifer tarandus platyrhynchus]CAI9692987.1 unnamed protein product [Rangifer tarandus platyrhynchus]
MDLESENPLPFTQMVNPALLGGEFIPVGRTRLILQTRTTKKKALHALHTDTRQLNTGEGFQALLTKRPSGKTPKESE